MILLAVLASAGCVAGNLPLLAKPTPTQTATLAPSPTPLPTATPTPTPTPLPGVRIQQGDAQMQLGDYDTALKEFQSALQGAADDDTRISAQIGIGQAFYAAGDCSSVQEVLGPLLMQFPDHPSTAGAYYYLAECYQAGGAYAQAAEAFAGYVRMRPGVLDVYLRTRQGQALEANGDYLGAINAYQAGIEAAQGADTERLQVRIARAYAALGDYVNAVRLYMAIYEATSSDYTRAEMNLLCGQAYQALGMPEQAYARYTDSVMNYPRAYDSYTALVALVNDGQPVDELARGLVDYFAAQDGVAIAAFQRYLAANPEHDGTAHYYIGLAQQRLGNHDEAIDEWRELIRDHPADRFWSTAWFDIAEAQWYFLDAYSAAAQTLLDYVALVPNVTDAPDALWTAGRIYERGGLLAEAAAAWERIIDEYPAYSDAYRALFMAGITHYRLEDYDRALIVFKRNLALATDGYDRSMAGLWVGKTLQARGDTAGAQSAFQQAAEADPTGYYSERAADLLAGREPFSEPGSMDLAYNLEREKEKADAWMRTQFGLQPEVDLSSLGELANDIRMVRGKAYLELGLMTWASAEFEDLRSAYQDDPTATYLLANEFLRLGLYRPAILSARQVLTLANLSDAESLQAPDYFSHIRFGTYYRDIVTQAAQAEGLNPLYLFAVIRQESFFESFAQSSAGARGLMQIMPATGEEIAGYMNWPQNYTEEDLLRPVVSIALGARYLSRQQGYLDNDPFAGLAAYNGGPGNALTWMNLARGDPDLFVEIIRYSETQSYVRRIYENYKIYLNLYDRSPQAGG